jgi:hypothetical protein
MNARLIASLTALIGFSAISLHAAPISGFGSPTGNAALVGGAVEGFDSAAAGIYTSFTTSNGVTITGLNSAGAPNSFTLGPDYINQYNTTGTNSIFNGPYDAVQNNLSQWTFTFASPVNAFGFNFGASDGSWTLSAFNSSNTFIETLLIPALGESGAGNYFGLADAGISYATLTAARGGDWVFIDNLTVPGSASRVPDGGSTLLLLGGMVATLCAISRRMRS